MRLFTQVTLLCLVALSATLPACKPGTSSDTLKKTKTERSSATLGTLEFDIARLRKPFPSDSFVAQQKYWDAVSKPNPYLSEYYGVHCLKRLSKARVLRDMVPKFARVLNEDANSLTLAFQAGFVFDFHFGKKLMAGNQLMDDKCDYAWVRAENVDELIRGVQGFRALLGQAGLEAAYLVPNPQFPLEQKVAARATSRAPAAQMKNDPTLAGFAADHEGILIMPDALHGDVERYQQLVQVLEKQRMDWFGIEMYGRQAQEALNTFVSGREGTPEFTAARQRLIDLAWKGKFADEANQRPEDNRYFKLIEICRRRGIRVYGMESADLIYDFWGHGETPFGAAVRNTIWADALPRVGKGVVFGGSAHMRDAANPGRNINVQDFIQLARPTTHLYLF